MRRIHLPPTVVLLLSLIPVAAQEAVLPDSVRADAAEPAAAVSDTVAVYSGPTLEGAYTRTLLGSIIFPAGGGAWGLAYADAPRDAKIAGGLQALGVILAIANLPFAINCAYDYEDGESSRACRTQNVLGPAALGSWAIGSVYALATIPGAVDRARARAGFPPVRSGSSTPPAAGAASSAGQSGPSPSAAAAPQRQPSDPQEPKGYLTAYALTLGVPILGIMGASTQSLGVAQPIMAAVIVLGPSAGQAYAGSYSQALLATGVRAAGLGMFVAGLESSDALLYAGGWTMIGGIGYSVIDTWFAVRRSNARFTGTRAVRTSLAPAFFPTRDGRVAPGLAFSATF